jgi:hypothetical protein
LYDAGRFYFELSSDLNDAKLSEISEHLKNIPELSLRTTAK